MGCMLMLIHMHMHTCGEYSSSRPSASSSSASYLYACHAHEGCTCVYMHGVHVRVGLDGHVPVRGGREVRLGVGEGVRRRDAHGEEVAPPLATHLG